MATKPGTQIKAMAANHTIPDNTDYAGSFEGPSVSTGNIPDGKWGYWWDTVNFQQFLVRNRAGTLYYVELNPL